MVLFSDLFTDIYFYYLILVKKKENVYVSKICCFFIKEFC